MHASTYAGAATALTILAAAGTAAAQEAPVTVGAGAPTVQYYDVAPPPGVIRAPRNALEIGVDAGWTMPFGDIQLDRSIHDVAGAGFSPGLDLAYRFGPHWSFGVGGQYHESSADDALLDGSRVRGFAVNLNGTFHAMPYRFMDPYVTLGTGYRGLWEVPPGAAPNSYIHGWEIGRLQIGVDYRLSKDIAIGPYVAADLNMFTWENVGSRPTINLQNR
ncbi:MAG TPA: hypothetical protein VHB21_03710, partial [Minicystis sp.]|nr:hypothetical protein [Minicystis sp.]